MNTLRHAILLTLLFTATCLAQTTYTDVLVVANTNSTISVNVANYFRAQRGIPPVNVCSFAMPTTEEIDSVQFVSITNTIRNYLVANNLTNTIQYIVTTQGVPLKVRRSTSVFDVYSNASSFDSDLALLQSTIENKMGATSAQANPYYTRVGAFSRASFQSIRLVTRLAGYSYAEITALIDRAAQPYMSRGTVYLDWDPTKTASMPSLLTSIRAARDTLLARGFNVLFDSTTTFLTNQPGALGYVSFGSNDANWTASGAWRARPNFAWSAKALVETFVSSSGRSFCDSSFIEPTIGWQSMAADLIHEGVTGVKAYVYEPYSSALVRPGLMYSAWTSGRNLAEAFYAASPRVSWMDVVIGDPKATLAGNGHLPVELTAFSGLLRNDVITLNWQTATETNNEGFEVQKRGDDGTWNALGFVTGAGTSSSARFYRFVDEHPATVNVYRLRQIDRDGTESITRAIEVAGAAQGFALLQNYPNPFNPSTTIAFTAGDESAVTLAIYSIDGRLVRTLAADEVRNAGTHAWFWDGRDGSGAQAASGMYVCRIAARTGDGAIFSATRTMTLAR